MRLTYPATCVWADANVQVFSYRDATRESNTVSLYGGDRIATAKAGDLGALSVRATEEGVLVMFKATQEG